MTQPNHLKELLNYATRIGVLAKLERTEKGQMEKAQMENLLASLEMTEDPALCLLVTAAYAHRQFSRGLIGRETAKLVNKAMSWLYEQNLKREEARKLLGLAKWIYECLEKTRISIEWNKIKELTFEEFLEKLRG